MITRSLTHALLFYLKKYGVEHCKIELMKEFPCENKTQLLREEERCIKHKKCVLLKL